MTAHEIIHNLASMTRDGSITWYVLERHHNKVQYGAIYNITKNKWIVFKLYGKEQMGEFYMIVRLTSKKQHHTSHRPIITLSSDNYLYGEDMEILYYSIRYRKLESR